MVIVEANRDLDEEEEQRKEGLLHTSAGVLGASASAAGPASCDPRAAHHRWTDDGRSRLRLWLRGRDFDDFDAPDPRPSRRKATSKWHDKAPPVGESPRGLI